MLYASRRSNTFNHANSFKKEHPLHHSFLSPLDSNNNSVSGTRLGPIYVGPYGGNKEIKRTYQFPAKHLAKPNPVITSGHNRNIVFGPCRSATLFEDPGLSRCIRGRYKRMSVDYGGAIKSGNSKEQEWESWKEGVSFTILARIVRARWFSTPANEILLYIPCHLRARKSTFI